MELNGSPLLPLSGLILLVAVTVGITILAKRVGWSAPLILVAVGAATTLVPGIGPFKVDPDLILYGLLPPLLFASAIRASLIDMRARRDPILLTSVGLVAFTVFVVGFTAWLIIPAVSLAAGFAFGAVVAPTDAIAVTAVTRKTRLPRLLTTILDGENLLNDATSLVALNAAIAAILSTLNPWGVAVDFGREVVGGLVLGLATGVLVGLIRSRIDAPVLDTTISLITPFVAFAAAQWVGGSGILAVVVAGLYLGYRSPKIQSADARIAEAVNWRTIEYLLENAVFLLIGLSLPTVLRGAADSGASPLEVILLTLGILITLYLARFIWGLLVTAAFMWGPERWRRISWHWNLNVPWSLAGIRGVVTLAAVFLLPEQTPQRSLLQLLAVLVVVASLLQGLLLPLAIRHLNLGAQSPEQERKEIEILLSEVQATGLRRLDKETEGIDERVFERLKTNATFLAGSLESQVPGNESLHQTYVRLRRLTLAAEREAVLQARKEGRYQEAAVQVVLRLIDADESSLNAAGD